MLLHLVMLLVYRTTTAAAEEKTDSEGYYCYGDGHLHTKEPCRFFAIVIDAGSTGTRLQLYRFVHSTRSRGLPFHAEKESFYEVKPGLSSFFDRPSEASASVAELIEKAMEIVPEELRGRTPIAVKATAGLRLLPGDAAQRIMEEVDSTVRSSGFACIDDCVGILDGSDEGVFSWFTLNLLLARFYHDSAGNEADPSPSRSAAAFDLGGGSTQVTYWPQSETVFKSHPEYRHDIDFFQSHMHLYTHSYLGSGLQSARLSILQGEEKDGEETELTSPCFPPDFRLPNWDQALKEWSVRGTPDYSLSACQETVRYFIRRSEIANLKDLHGSSHLYLFSYFSDRARQAGLVKEGETMKRVKVKEWEEAARRACSVPSSSFSSSSPHWLPWQCLDFTYIHSLLKDGYGFDDDQIIIPVTSINGMGVSWALGMAYSLVDEYHSRMALEDVDDVDGSDDRDQRSSTVNATGVEMVDSLLTVISQKTTDVLQYFNLVS